MISLTGNTRIFLFRSPMDMRKGFEALSYAVEIHFGEDLTSGAYFVFLNKRKDRMKVLYWDADGLAIWYKRLEKGTFASDDSSNILLTRKEFLILLEGIVPRRIKCRHNIP